MLNLQLQNNEPRKILFFMNNPNKIPKMYVDELVMHSIYTFKLLASLKLSIHQANYLNCK